MSRDEDYRFPLPPRRQQRMVSEDVAQRYADALIAIVGQPWLGCYGLDDPGCPGCARSMCGTAHEGHCPWLIAARALGIA